MAMGVPFTVSKGKIDEAEPGCGVEQEPGSMLTEAPMSTRYLTPVMWSLRNSKRPGRMALTPPRQPSFPSSCKAGGS